MGDYHTGPLPAGRIVTLNSLKDELHALNMRLLLAMQHHNEEAQRDIEAQMKEVQAEIDRMCLGGNRGNDRISVDISDPGNYDAG